MRKYLNINLGDQSIETEELNGLGAVRVGRHFIAKTLLEKGAAAPFSNKVLAIKCRPTRTAPNPFNSSVSID